MRLHNQYAPLWVGGGAMVQKVIWTFRISAHVFLKRYQNTAQQATFLKFFLRSYLMALSYEKKLVKQSNLVEKKQCKK